MFQTFPLYLMYQRLKSRSSQNFLKIQMSLMCHSNLKIQMYLMYQMYLSFLKTHLNLKIQMYQNFQLLQMYQMLRQIH
jgi:hypothetical protein